MKTIGLIGAGHIGSQLARLADLLHAAATTTRHGAVDSLPRADDLTPEGPRIPLHR